MTQAVNDYKLRTPIKNREMLRVPYSGNKVDVKMIEELNERYKPLVWFEEFNQRLSAYADTYYVSLDAPREDAHNWRATIHGISFFYGYGLNYADALDDAFKEAIFQNQFQIERITQLFSVLDKTNPALM
jgi:hypothetical protein